VFKSIRVAAKSVKSAITITGVFTDDVNSVSSKAPGFKGDVGETFSLASGDEILIGLGKRTDLKADTIRTVGARLIKRLDKLQAKAADVRIGSAISNKVLDSRTLGRCLGEGIGLANFRVDFFSGNATNIKPAHPTIRIIALEASVRAGLEHGLSLAESTNYARKIGATPPNMCNPTWMASEARKMARSTGLKCRVIDFGQAKKLGMGGIVNVGIGSASKPCMMILEHKPSRVSSRAKHVKLALVGKTMTYDTGGYSLKVNNGMKGMKYDKLGGMAVLGAMHAIATMKIPVHVVALLPCAENMVSDIAYRPDDIITQYNGVTVEVTNTDAEGRLILGDALAYACKDLQATHIVDLATLTGGIITALGHFCAGVFCNDDKLLARVNDAAETSGEKVWRMPLWKDHKEFMRSQHADILNSNPSRNAHPIQGAAFLAYFVDDKIPWAHIDIAGVGNVEKDTDLFVNGPTGWGVRLLVDLAEEFAG
jgi:leucyl aminopeptidase